MIRHPCRIAMVHPAGVVAAAAVAGAVVAVVVGVAAALPLDDERA